MVPQKYFANLSISPTKKGWNLTLKGWNLTLPEPNSSSLKIGHPTPRKETIVFQPSIFRCEPFVSGRVNTHTFEDDFLFLCDLVSPKTNSQFAPEKMLGLEDYFEMVPFLGDPLKINMLKPKSWVGGW